MIFEPFHGGGEEVRAYPQANGVKLVILDARGNRLGSALLDVFEANAHAERVLECVEHVEETA